MELTIRCGKHRNIYKFIIMIAMFPCIILIQAIAENTGIVGIFITALMLTFIEVMYDTGSISDRNMKIEADDDKIKICYNKTNIEIDYNSIKSVVLVTYCGRDYEDEFHRVRIITKGKRYTFYSTTNDEYEKIPYEQTDLARLYNLLKSKGVSCC